MRSLLSSLRAHPGLAEVNPELLESTAQAWIGSGAAWFGVWLGDECIAGWPDENPPDGDALFTPLKLKGITPQLRA